MCKWLIFFSTFFQPICFLPIRYWEKVMYLKVHLYKFRNFVSKSAFGELQLTQISLNFLTSCCNLKIKGLWAKLCVAFLLSLFWNEIWCVKVKKSMLFVEKNIKFSKNEMKSKMENTTNGFREINQVLQLTFLSLLCCIS